MSLTPTPITGDIQVNTYTFSGQLYSSVAALDGGGFVVTWTSNSQDGSGSGIYGQRYTAAGAADGGEFRVNTTTAIDQIFSSVAALDGGGFVVTWSSSGQDGSSYGIYGQRYDADGNPVGAEFRVNTYTTSDQIYSSVAALDGGGFVVTWSSKGQDGSGFGIYGQRFDANGIAEDAEFRVNTATGFDQITSSVAALADGGFVVTWSGLGSGDGSGIYGQRYDAAGAADGGEFRVNTYTTSDQLYSSVAALDGGGFVVTWSSAGQDGSGYGIYGQRYDATGAPDGGEFRVNTYTTNDQIYSSVAALDGGGFVVTWSSSATWSSSGQDGSGYGIYGQRYDAAGAPIGAEFQLNQITAGDQIHQTSFAGEPTAVLADGTLVSTWQGSGPTDANGVVVRLFDVPGALVYGYWRDDISTGGTDTQSDPALSGGGTNIDWAVGAFSGTNGLPSSITSAADFNAYAAALLGKTDEVSSTPLDLDLSVDRFIFVGGTGNDSMIVTSSSTAGGSAYGGAGNDTIVGGIGGDVIDGGAGADSLSGGALFGDDLFLAVAGDLVPGEVIDGGGHTTGDELQLLGGGFFDFAGVSLINIEFVTTDPFENTYVSVPDAATAAQLTNLAGESDTAFIESFAFLTTFGTPGDRTAAFGVLDALYDAGAEFVEWLEGGALNTAERLSDGTIVIASTDQGGSGNTWSTSTFTFDAATGNRIEKVTVMDDGSIVTRDFGDATTDTLLTQTTTGIPGAQDTSTITFDSAGRWDSREITYDSGGSTRYDYDDSGRVDTLTQTQANGVISTSQFNDSNVRTSLTQQDTGNVHGGWQEVTTVYDGTTGQMLTKTILGDDGNTTVETYAGGVIQTRVTTDGGANEAWATITQTYVGGVLDSTYHAYDAGTGILQGTAGANTLQGGAGINDALIGNGGADTFVLAIGDGNDRILDFDIAEDVLDLSAFSIFNYADLQSVSHADIGPQVVLDFTNGDTLQINNLHFADLQDAMFVPIS